MKRFFIVFYLLLLLVSASKELGSGQEPHQVYSSSSLVPSVDCSSLPTGPWNEGKLTPGPVYRKSRTVFAPGSRSKVSNFVIAELFYFHILNQYRVSFFIQEVSHVYTSLFLDTDELKVALLVGKVPGPFRPYSLIC